MKNKILIILAIITICAQTASAASIGAFTTYPSFTDNQNKWIIRDANPGQITEDYITVENLSDETITLNLDIRELKGTRNKPEIIESSKHQNIGNWTKLEQNQITLTPHEKKKIKVTIQIPTRIHLGQYQEVVLVSHASSSESNVDIKTRIGDRIYLNITDNTDLQDNTQNLIITPTQLILIILASFGLFASIIIPQKQK